MQANYGWTEYDVKEKTWQVLTNDGSIYVKTDMKGNFINIANGEKVPLNQIWGKIKNCTNSEGIIIAKRKKFGTPLMPMKRRVKIS
ncbi:hypothetical protein ACQRXC_29405 (plasmid) [Niallia taxi]|uniref:hypothetical protein n=1 Tax=Niallia taxi TaxID=2499688 RepID=UPI0035981D2B